MTRAAAVPAQGCVLFNNWWPMLTGLMYVLVPMPYLFFGASGEGMYSGSLASGWVPAAAQALDHAAGRVAGRQRKALRAIMTSYSCRSMGCGAVVTCCMMLQGRSCHTASGTQEGAQTRARAACNV